MLSQYIDSHSEPLGSGLSHVVVLAAHASGTPDPGAHPFGELIGWQEMTQPDHTTAPPDGAAPFQDQLLAHIGQLTGIGIEPAEVAVVAGHEPALLARWLHHAYQIAAAYRDAMDVMRDDLRTTTTEQAFPDLTDTTALWLANLGDHLTATTAAATKEISRFRHVSHLISDLGAYDLVWMDPEPGDGGSA